MILDLKIFHRRSNGTGSACISEGCPNSIVLGHLGFNHVHIRFFNVKQASCLKNVVSITEFVTSRALEVILLLNGCLLPLPLLLLMSRLIVVMASSSQLVNE